MYKNKNYQYGYLPKINYWLGNHRALHQNGDLEPLIGGNIRWSISKTDK